MGKDRRILVHRDVAVPKATGGGKEISAHAHAGELDSPIIDRQRRLEVLEQQVEILRGPDAAFSAGGFQTLGCYDDARTFPKLFDSFPYIRWTGFDLLNILANPAGAMEENQQGELCIRRSDRRINQILGIQELDRFAESQERVCARRAHRLVLRWEQAGPAVR